MISLISFVIRQEIGLDCYTRFDRIFFKKMNRKIFKSQFLLSAVFFLLLLGWYRRLEPSDRLFDEPIDQGKTEQRSGLNQVWNLLFRRTSLQPENSTHGLPKILHQVWTNTILPNEFVDNVKGLVKLNPPPEWKYYFWTQETGRKLMERKYPSLLKLFDHSDNVQRANMIRLIAIHQYGGAYFDLDTVAVKPLKPFVENTTCSIVPVTPEHYIDKDSIIRPLLITNNVLLCQPFHPYYDAIIQKLETQPIRCQRSIQCTGPFFISHVYDEMRKKGENFDILPRWESYELFQDKIAAGSLTRPDRVCSGRNIDGAEVWRREMCNEWRRRGGSNRTISKLAYTYHTWYHVRTHKVTATSKNVITNVVPHVIFYD